MAYTPTVNDATLDAAYVARGVLDPTTLDTIRQANSAFLDLVERRRRRMLEAEDFYGVPRSVAEELAALAAPARAAVARCPYSLFNLRFEDAGFWRGVVLDARRSTPGILEEEAEFARTAVFVAWHLAQSSEFAAALVLGMTPPVQEAWLALPLSALDRAAMAALPHLTARWGGHPQFWPSLLAAAQVPRDEHAEQVRLLGLQLLAAEGFRMQGDLREQRRAR